MSFITTTTSSLAAAAVATATVLNPCVICKAEACFIIPGLSSSQSYCLMHYYTTGKYNDYNPAEHSPSKKKQKVESKKNKNTSLFVDYERMKRQLPKVQELFAEAFVELQAEIGEESARAFQKAHDAVDPLADLLADDGSSLKSMPSQSIKKYHSFHRSNTQRKSADKRATASNDDTEGGFIRESILPEKYRKLQHPNMNIDYASNLTHKSSISTITSTKIRKEIDTNNNPYRKRKKTSSIWHQILDNDDMMSKGNNSDDKKPKAKRNWDDMEKEMVKNITSSTTTVPSKKCTSCKSTNIEILGNSTSRNSDMTKGEVWGQKDRGEVVVERCRCLYCGRIWNDE